MKRMRGFSLMELMVVIAVVALLTRLAVPLYTASAHKSRRAECRAALVVAVQNEERYFTNNNAYNTLSAIGSPTWSGTGTTPAAAACTLTAYAGTVGTIGTALSGTSSTLTVVAQPNGWTDSECNAGAYGLDSAGNFAPLSSSLAAVSSSSIPPNCF